MVGWDMECVGLAKSAVHIAKRRMSQWRLLKLRRGSVLQKSASFRVNLQEWRAHKAYTRAPHGREI